MNTVPHPINQFIAVVPWRAELAPRIRHYWYLWLVIAATAIQLVALWRVLHPLGATSYPPLKDSVIFEYIGWYITEGGRLYIDIWEIKPPLSFEVAALLAFLADGNVRLYHTLVLAVTNAAAVGCAFVVGLLTYELTEDEAASVAGGLALFALPAFHWRAAFGFKAKYFVLLFGLLAVYLVLRERPFLAGSAGAASVGFWQLGVVFPALAIGLVYQRGNRRDALRWLAGGGLVTAFMLAPIVWWGAIDEMLAEVVLTPLLVTNNGGTALAQLQKAVNLFGRTLPLVVLGAFGLLVAVRRNPSARWWLLAGASWFGVQIIALDLDAYPDLIPGFAFVALGIGLVLGDRDQPPSAVYGLTAVMVGISVVTFGPLAGAQPVTPPEAASIDAPYRGAERPGLLWRSVRTETCRPFFGATQANVIDITGGTIHDETCGERGPLWEALRQRSVERVTYPDTCQRHSAWQ